MTDIVQTMTPAEAENHARLHGLLAVLALPMLCGKRGGPERRRLIEIEVAPNQWMEIHGATIEAHRLIFWSGCNGTRKQIEFHASEGCPRWRIEPQDRSFLCGEAS